ncbi:MAG: peroxide stress protein YaaA [Rhodospirillales bacterium]|jgi:uncharacterized protein|nr:peroxide stress protein YaaA [Rhodospirillales bacterium]
MLAIVSPAKKIDTSDLTRALPHTKAVFSQESQELVEAVRKMSKSELQNMMKISDALTDLNFHRFKDFAVKETKANAKQAVMAFAGDTYVGLEAKTLDDYDLNYAQDRLRILSGLYGVLRPLDLIQPYRLEMGRRLDTEQASDLYGFWDSRIGDALEKDVKSHKAAVLVNLASVEYFKAIQPKIRSTRIITPVFKEEKNGVAKVLGMFAKRARGSMARYMITNRIEDPEDLKSFDTGGYQFQAHVSDADTWIFVRQS